MPCTAEAACTVPGRPVRWGLTVTLLLGCLGAAFAEEAEEVERLEEVVVVASKTERPLERIPGQVSTFTAERLAVEQVQVFADIARYEPTLEADFEAARFGASGLSIRGIGGNRVALEFDGVPLPQQYAVGNFADSSRLALDPSIVRRVEILRGPASALYGSDAIGGVVAITSADGDMLVRPGRRWHAGARTGYFGANDAWLGAGTAAFDGAADSVIASLGHRQGGAPDNRARGVARDRIDFRQWQGFGKWTHDFAFGGTLRVSLDRFTRDTTSDIRSLPGFGRFVNTTSLRGDDRQETERTTVSFALHERGWLSEASVMVYRQANRTRQHTGELRTSRGVPVRLSRDFSLRELGYGGELRSRWDFDTGPLGHVLVAGAEWDHQRLTEVRDGTETNLLTGTTVRTILGERFPLRDMPKSVSDEVGVYAQDEVALGPVTVTAALRFDDFSLDARPDPVFSDPDRLTDLHTNRVTTRLGVSWSALDSLTLYAHYAQGFRAPPPGDVNLFLDIPLFNFRALPNPDLRPERSETVETGLRVRFRATVFDLAGYYTDYDDFIETRARLGTDPVSGALLFQSRNLERAHIYGLEARLVQGLAPLHRALAPLSLEAAFHVSRGENDVSGAPLNEVNPLKAVFALRYTAPVMPLHVELRATHLARQHRVDFTDGAFFVPPAANVLDAVVRWQPSPGTELHLGAYNLTNARYWRYADVRRLDPGDPRVEIASRPGVHGRVTLSFSY